MPQRSLTVDEAFTYCASLTNAHYENFPVASLFLPAEKRPYIQSIYAFARTADDFADEPAQTTAGRQQRNAQERLALLEDWELQLQRCYHEDANNVTMKPTHPIFIALKETTQRLGIPIQPLKDLLGAFKMDVTKNRFATFEEVLHYCRHSANPVGRLVLMIFGHRDEELFALSDKICTALQLANFWQDIAIDSKRNRIYIPQSDLRHFDYSEEDLLKEVVDERFRALLQYEVERTRELFYEGSPLPSLVNDDLRLELKLIWFGGMAILRKIERIGFDVFHRRPVLHVGNKVAIFFNGLFRKNLATYKRKQLWDLT